MNNNLEILLDGQQFKKLYERECSHIYKKYGLTKLEIEVLLFLGNNKPYDTAKDIVELLSFAKSHVSKAITSLINSGYVSAKLDEQDRRCIHLEVSADAEQVVREANEMRNNLIAILYKGISVEEINIMNNVARKIALNIRETLWKGE